jgi:hypothetical protein
MSGPGGNSGAGAADAGDDTVIDAALMIIDAASEPARKRTFPFDKTSLRRR